MARLGRLAADDPDAAESAAGVAVRLVGLEAAKKPRMSAAFGFHYGFELGVAAAVLADLRPRASRSLQLAHLGLDDATRPNNGPTPNGYACPSATAQSGSPKTLRLRP